MPFCNKVNFYSGIDIATITHYGCFNCMKLVMHLYNRLSFISNGVVFSGCSHFKAYNTEWLKLLCFYSFDAVNLIVGCMLTTYTRYFQDVVLRLRHIREKFWSKQANNSQYSLLPIILFSALLWHSILACVINLFPLMKWKKMVC